MLVLRGIGAVVKALLGLPCLWFGQSLVDVHAVKAATSRWTADQILEQAHRPYRDCTFRQVPSWIVDIRELHGDLPEFMEVIRDDLYTALANADNAQDRTPKDPDQYVLLTTWRLSERLLNELKIRKAGTQEVTE
jgi:hypothetical protein